MTELQTWLTDPIQISRYVWYLCWVTAVACAYWLGKNT